MIRYALRNKETMKFIALDEASGGYPYDANDLFEAKLFSNIHDAVAYTAVMSYSNYANPLFDLYEIGLTASPLRMPTGRNLEASRYRRIDGQWSHKDGSVCDSDHYTEGELNICEAHDRRVYEPLDVVI